MVEVTERVIGFQAEKQNETNSVELQTDQGTGSDAIPDAPEERLENMVLNKVTQAAVTSEEAKLRRGCMSSNSSGNRNSTPLYLRASTSSCHDMCKYGREHTFQKKEQKQSTVHKPLGIKRTVPAQYGIRRLSLGEREEKRVLGPDSNRDMIVAEELSDGLPVEKETSLPRTRKLETVVNVAYSPERKHLAEKVKPGNKKQMPFIQKPKSLDVNSVSSSSVSLSSRRSCMSNGQSSSMGELTVAGRLGFSSLHQSNWIAGRGTRRDTSDLSNLVGANVQKRSDRIMSRNKGLSGAELRKALTQTPTALAPKTSFNKISQHNNLRRSQNRQIPRAASKCKKSEMNEETKPEMYQEPGVNTIYIMESEPERRKTRLSPSSSSSRLSRISACTCPSISSQDDHLSGEPISSEEEGLISERADIRTGNQGEAMKDGSNTNVRSTFAHNESKDGVRRKHSFRSGKMISLEPVDNKLRRVKFRRGRVVEDDRQSGKADPRRRSFRRRKEVVGRELKMNRGSQTVVLRHQDAQGKKEEQVCLNEVIEVTANKLVETRKSKVKALVAAFETVISLHESKPVPAM